MEDDHVMHRITRLEETEKEMGESLIRLSIHMERLSSAVEVISTAIARQYEVNEKLNDVTNRMGNIETSMNMVKVVGGAFVTSGIAIILVYLFT